MLIIAQLLVRTSFSFGVKKVLENKKESTGISPATSIWTDLSQVTRFRIAAVTTRFAGWEFVTTIGVLRCK
jgi:hypothetical protein